MVKSGVSKFTDQVKALLGVSTFQKPPTGLGYNLDDPEVTRMRDVLAGGQLAGLPITRTRWYLADLETAQRKADTGDLAAAAQLWSAMRSDGKIWGLRKTLSSGVVRLPRRFRGDEALTKELEKTNDTPSAFDAMFPPAELALFIDDAVGLGVAVGELCPVEDRDLPRFTRLEPEFLWYQWTSNRWFYRSVIGNLPITPGDGRWMLHLPGGIVNPWRNGLWRALGRAYINKEHALLSRSNYSSKLANPARVARSPIGATEPERLGMLARVIAWGLNTAFELPVGWDVTLIESNGRGFQVFQDEISTSDEEATIAIAGQTVTTDGGAGFSNADVHELIREDILQDVADAIAHTLNTQGLTVFSFLRVGDPTKATIEYVTKKPKDHEAQGRTMQITANGIAQLRAALGPDGKKPNILEITTQFGIPIVDMTPEEISKFEAAQKPMAAGATAEQVATLDDETPPGRTGDRGSKSEQKDAREAAPGGSSEPD